MNRKEFLKGMAAVVGSLAVPGSVRAADFHSALQDAPAAGDAAFWKLIRDEFVLDPGWSYLNFGGLGTCPISAIRNAVDTVSNELGLPEGVFPIAGLCVGYPAAAGHISPRLPLEVTVHTDHYDESRLREHVDAYDQRRHANHPYGKQRRIKQFGTADFYGWSEDKARQYAEPERADFGDYIRRQGFSLK